MAIRRARNARDRRLVPQIVSVAIQIRDFSISSRVQTMLPLTARCYVHARESRRGRGRGIGDGLAMAARCAMAIVYGCGGHRADIGIVVVSRVIVV